MQKINVFIDGAEGTTGLQLRDRLLSHPNVTLIEISEDKRKDKAERERLINEADAVFLCLPDDAAKESVSLCRNGATKIIDASTAHRTQPDWAYGLPELSPKHRELIRESKRVAVPGCYASGFVSLVFPLITSGVISPDTAVYSHAVSGYSGAGKKGIAEYEANDRAAEYDAPREYALSGEHKHLPEMKLRAGLNVFPVFNPLVADYYSGMAVYLPFHTSQFERRVTTSELGEIYRAHYANETLVKYVDDVGAFSAANHLTGRDDLEIFVSGNNERVLTAARLDNLGKGASGAAVQCLNIMFQLPETTGLRLYSQLNSKH
ncbi:MAG: N-acetyl-gamma-glutamyl-phosphate reductase [Oscillospiraceae bacterium]|jgi:N-acetyl-gamma-glutamyl-phosphate reductase|nr:N-acetyl-gamma-glutamyl-phosphate reductase [Oscillospiraceae bacterium]